MRICCLSQLTPRTRHVQDRPREHLQEPALGQEDPGGLLVRPRGTFPNSLPAQPGERARCSASLAEALVKSVLLLGEGQPLALLLR